MLSLALALLFTSADTHCTRFESATEVVTVCSKRTDVAPATKQPRWIWVFVKDVSWDGRTATVVDTMSDETWTVPAWQVGGVPHIGRNVRLYTRHGVSL